MTTPEELDALQERLDCDCDAPICTLKDARAAITALRARVAELEAERDDARAMLAKANNEFGSETWSWPDLWRRIAQLKDLSNERWRRAEAAEAELARRGQVQVNPALDEIVAFLCGERPLEGAWFGDPPPAGRTGNFWWREVLRAALVSPGDGWVADLNAKIRADVAAMAAERGVTPGELLATAAKNLAALRAAPPASEGA